MFFVEYIILSLYLNEIKESEKYHELSFYDKDSLHSSHFSEKLFFEDTDVKKIDFLPPSDYFNLLFGNMNREILTEKLNERHDSKRIQYNVLQRLPTSDKVEYILKKTTKISVS